MVVLIMLLSGWMTLALLSDECQIRSTSVFQCLASAEGRIAYSPHVFQAMGVLAEVPGSRAADLAAALGLRPTTASSLITRLVTRGLVEKRAHPRDGRAVALYLSAEGADLYAAIRRQDMRNMELMLSGLAPDERADFVEKMGRVAARVREAARVTDD